MTLDPFTRTAVDRTALRPTRLGFGTAEIGGLFRAVSDEDAAMVLEHAWEIGIRYFDTAPLYGYGNAERRLGSALRDRPRDEFVLSTKVGRLLVPIGAVPEGADVDRQAVDGVDDASYVGTPPVRVVFDYSYDGVLRSVEASLERLGLDRIDILYVHDPDDHWEAAIRGAIPALHRLRDGGTVGAIGAGMNQAPMLARFVREGDIDAVLVAGRYTLLDQAALPELMPLCLERNVAVMIGGVMNSGILADPRPGARFNYASAPPALVERAQGLRAVCERHGVPLRAAAIQFALAHPAVRSLVTGVRTIDHLDDYPALLAVPIPDALWTDLRTEGLIDPAAHVPSAGASSPA
jgi:D-threo-aldose 1-dehydrogenase